MHSQTLFFIIKTILSGLVIAIISVIAKKNSRWAAMLTALPMMTILSLIWIYLETGNKNLIASYSKDVMIWVLPSFFFFIAAMYLFKTALPFWISLALALFAMYLGVLLFQKMGIL